MSFNEKRSVGDATSYIQFGTYNENFIAFSTFHPAVIANTSHVDTFHFIRLNCLISRFLIGLHYDDVTIYVIHMSVFVILNAALQAITFQTCYRGSITKISRSLSKVKIRQIMPLITRLTYQLSFDNSVFLYQLSSIPLNSSESIIGSSINIGIQQFYLEDSFISLTFDRFPRFMIIVDWISGKYKI